MLWIKWLHIVFMVTWFAGLFYLPRLFVYHASSEDTPSRERFKIMERKLYENAYQLVIHEIALAKKINIEESGNLVSEALSA